MRHQKKGKTLGRKRAPRRAMFRNMATSFVLYEKVTTTEAKAKVLRPIVEKLITLSKIDTLHNRRQALKFLYIESSVKKLFEILGPRFKERKGGYTRIVKLPARQGDAADMAVIELVEKTIVATTPKKNESKKSSSTKVTKSKEKEDDKLSKKTVKKTTNKSETK